MGNKALKEKLEAGWLFLIKLLSDVSRQSWYSTSTKTYSQPPMFRSSSAKGPIGLVLLQDNDPKQKAKETMDLFAQKCPKLLDWPFNPDLNLIENLWSILEKEVNK
ncbi:hypothetical protein RhiirA4_461022 [Rhizophagus irregularis]|uniref:Tc1-like transposase DDE domain-containing protein n=1 Tax=Rhizophagus irregularis TaxID=588596 RepID=A0A2I1GHU6_9GLOM|nr:hypothetical protein RhiirA4_461022 [Rhizophagus irregularis]